MKKLIISSDTLKPALAKLGHAVDTDPFLPVLNNLYCKVSPGQVELIGSNTEITIFHRMQCEATESFEFLLSYKFITKIVSLNKHCPIEIEAAAKSVIVKGPNDEYKIQVADKLKDFPKFPEVTEENGFEIKGDILRCLTVALDTTGKVDGKPQLLFVLMELSPGKITIASSDGSYMVFSKEFSEVHQLTAELLLSQKVIKSRPSGSVEIVKVFFNDKAIRFEAGDVTIINTRSEDRFVNFRKVFPEEWPGNLTVERDVLIEALTKCSMVDDQLRATKFDLGKNEEIKLSSDDSTLQVNVAVPVTYTGDVKLATVNSEKLLKLLYQVEHDELTMAIHDSQRAIVLTSKEDAGYKGMIMPIASSN